jgi:hypothetical protein
MNDIVSGLGTFYSQTGVYIGSWVEGIQEGNGTALYNNGNKYTGQYKNGFKEGYGLFEVANGDVYRGFFRKGELNHNCNLPVMMPNRLQCT